MTTALAKACTTLFGMINASSERETKEHTEFLAFYETLVAAASPAVSIGFGTLSVSITRPGHADDKAGLMLTPADYLYWREAILTDGYRFKGGVSFMKRQVFDAISKCADSHNMTPSERQAFIDLMKSERQ